MLHTVGRVRSRSPTHKGTPGDLAAHIATLEEQLRDMKLENQHVKRENASLKATVSALQTDVKQSTERLAEQEARHKAEAALAAETAKIREEMLRDTEEERLKAKAKLAEVQQHLASARLMIKRLQRSMRIAKATGASEVSVLAINYDCQII
jgi:chromosome segregation ATPase